MSDMSAPIDLHGLDLRNRVWMSALRISVDSCLLESQADARSAF